MHDVQRHYHSVLALALLALFVFFNQLPTKGNISLKFEESAFNALVHSQSEQCPTHHKEATFAGVLPISNA